jgi:hypothetical protein
VKSMRQMLLFHRMRKMSDFKFECPHCEQSLEAPADMQGCAIDCPNPDCGQSLVVPRLDTSPDGHHPPLVYVMRWATLLVALCVFGLVVWATLDYLKERDRLRTSADRAVRGVPPASIASERAIRSDAGEVPTAQDPAPTKVFLTIQEIAEITERCVVILSVFDSEGKTKCTGTGFLISSDGKLITNAHVIQGAREIIAKNHNGAFFRVRRVVTTDEKNDLAILQLDVTDMPSLAVGDSDHARKGDRIVIVGSPFGFEGTLSEGVVSALRKTDGHLTSIQFTAAISPGSSGSPLIGLDGKVIGVATCTVRDGQALNFAIPINAAMTLLQANAPQDSGDHTLFAVRINAKYGYIDREGSMVIEPEYDSASEFAEGLARVVMFSSDKQDIAFTRFINAEGHTVLDVTGMTTESEFVEGMLLFQQKEKWGFLDKTARVAIPATYDYALDFSEGLAYVEMGDKFGYIDKRGHAAIPPRFDAPQRVGNHYLAQDMERWGSCFSHGFAKVRLGTQFGYIDKSGKQVIRALFTDARRFAENGLACVKQEGLWGYINLKGEFVVRPKYRNAWTFSDGLAAVLVAPGLYGFINDTGYLVIPGRFSTSMAPRFQEGLCPVMVNGKYGYINESGRIIIEPLFDEAYSFRNGLAKVQFGKHDFGEFLKSLEDPNYIRTASEEPAEGYIDTDGNYAWIPTR